MLERKSKTCEGPNHITGGDREKLKIATLDVDSLNLRSQASL